MTRRREGYPPDPDPLAPPPIEDSGHQKLTAQTPHVRAGSDPATSTPPGWSRPKPVRKDSNARAWFWFFAALSLMIALWIPVRALYQRTRYKPATGGPRDASSFIALAYGGISSGKVRGPEDVTRRQFEQQIRTLRERGFNPIGLPDVQDFYQHGKPLPRKAVLVTMEQSKKSSYLETRKILQENRWNAVMFVRADTIRDRDPSALRWPILREMALSGTWSLGAQSFEGFRSIPSGPDAQTGNFFSTPQWLEHAFRLETPEEFARRVERDHERMVEEFTSGVGTPPSAFAFPYGDYGQYDPRAIPTRVMNLSAVERLYGIGFSLGPFLLNTSYSDPRALNRLLVRPEWSLEQFISIVESGWAMEPWTMERPLERSRWLADWGVAQNTQDEGLLLRAATREETGNVPTTGALAWLVASDVFQDFMFQMRFRILAGQFGIRLRARSGGEEGLRILLDANGSAWASQKVYGAEEFTHAAVQKLGFYPGKDQVLQVYLQNRKLFVELDGTMLFKEPLELIGNPHPGLFGIEVWDPEPGTAATQILSLEFPKPRQILKNWPAGEAYVIQQNMRNLAHEFGRLALISPPWMDAGRNIPLVLPKWDDITVRTFARMHDVLVLPRITLHSIEQTLQIPSELPAIEAAAMEVDGVQLDCRLLAQEEMPLLMPWVQDVHRNLKEKNMTMAIHFPTSLARLASFTSIASLFPGALIALDADDHARELQEILPNTVIAEEIAPPTADMHMNLYYQLASRAMPPENLSLAARMEQYRREGYLAYQEGFYERAIEQWSRWLELEPNSAEALNLIGRTHVQRGDRNQGADFYRKSLEVGPGQIGLVVRFAELLDQMESPDESRELLNLYARIFPENPDILIAQAQWLDRRKRRLEARGMVEALVKEDPMNLSARLALLRLQDQSQDRYQTMRGVLELGRTPDSQVPFGHSLLSMEMLTYPESAIFFDYIRQQAALADSTKQRDLYEGFLPLTHRVTDDFASGRLSEGWIASGGIRAMDRGRYELRAAIDQSETYLRLRRSELMRDGSLEVVLDESQGFFWIYARRSSRAMVRFGFDQEGYIHMQTWLDGDMLSHAMRPWIRPPGSIRMRMTIRGDGVRGFVNGLEIFNGPVEIGPQVAYGWWGIAPFAFDLGVARARIIRMDCEPSPAKLVLVPPGDAMQQATTLRPYVGRISALVPAWIFQNPDGSLPEGLPEDVQILRMFTAFHGIRLLPAVDLSYEGDVAPERVVEFIRRNNLAGVVLKRRSPPPRRWLDALTESMEASPASILVMQTEAALWNTPRAGEQSRRETVVRPKVADHLLPAPGETIRLTEIPIGSVLIAPIQPNWNIPLRGLQEPVETDPEDLTTPRIFLMGTDEALSMPGRD